MRSNVSTGGRLAGPGLAGHGYDVVALSRTEKPRSARTPTPSPMGAEPIASPARRTSMRSRRTPPNTSRPMAASAPMARRWARSSTAIRVFGRSSTAGSISISTATSRPMVQGHRRQYRQGRQELEPHPGVGGKSPAATPASDRHPKPATQDHNVMPSSSDIAFSRRGQGRAGAARLAQAATPDGAKGGSPTTVSPDLAAFIAEARSLLPRHREHRRPALYPASRRPPGLPARARRPNARLRRLRRQPAIHHHRQPRRERARVHLPHGLRQPSASEAVGNRARRRGRPRADAAPILDGYRGRAGAGHPLLARGVGCELPAAHPADALRRGHQAGGR